MRRIGAVAAALFALVGTAYGGAGRTIEETESWRTAIFWLIFIFLSIMIEMLFHNTEHFLEHHKKKGCAHGDAAAALVAAQVPVDVRLVDDAALRDPAMVKLFGRLLLSAGSVTPDRQTAMTLVRLFQRAGG